MYIPPELKKSLNIPLSPSASALNDLIGAIRQYKTTGKIKKLFNAAAKGDLAGIETLLATGFDLAGYRNKPIGQYGTKKYLMSAAIEAARHGHPETADIIAAAIVGDTAQLSRDEIKRHIATMQELGDMATGIAAVTDRNAAHANGDDIKAAAQKFYSRLKTLSGFANENNVAPESAPGKRRNMQV